MTADVSLDHSHRSRCDLLVIGSGAAGLTAALTAARRGLRVIVIEKEADFGGTTALSEGMIWVPMSRQAVAAGVEDSEAAALTYMRAAAGRYFSPGKAAAYVHNASAMLAFVEANTLARFTLAA